MSPKQRWKTPDERMIAEAMRRASERLRQLYPGATLAASPMTWQELARGPQISSVSFLGLIAVTRADGRQVSYAVRWDAREERGRLTIER